MTSNVEALKDLYVALGGDADDVAEMSQSVEVLNAIAVKYSGDGDAALNPDAIENIAAIADSIGGGGGDSDFEAVEMTFQLEEGLSEANLSGFFIFNYGQEDEYSSATFTVSAESTVHCVMYKGFGEIYGTGFWFEGDNIAEYGGFTGGGTVIIHENTD